MGKLPLSVAIITYNEEDIIGRTLESVRDIASEIIVVDSHSTDRTREIAQSYGAKVYVEDWKGYAGQKNSALEKCTQEWILFLDADEVVSDELRNSITEELKNPKADGYLINRRTYYLGKLLRYAWQPEWRLFLVRKYVKPKWVGEPHATLTIASNNIRKLKGDLIHFPYKDFEEHMRKSLAYAYISAEEYKNKGKKFKVYNLIFNPVWAFFREYVLDMAFMDGIRGLLIGFSYLISTFVKYAYLWEMWDNEAKSKRNNTGL